MSTTTYKGFHIQAEPYLLHEARRWTVDLEIRWRGRSQPINLDERYASRQEAESHSASVARLIIDGGLPKWSVDELRGSSPRRWSGLRVLLPSRSGGHAHRRPRSLWTLIQSSKGGQVRPSLIAGIVLLLLGVFLLVRGGSFTSREDVLSVGDLQITAEERQTIPAWVGVGVLVAGAAVLLVGMKKQS
ncbi:MAG: CV_2116 domain-containing protein [Gemmatimonadales bacterium]